jgi:hypothetical protein
MVYKEVIKEGYTRVTEVLHPFSGFDNAPEFVKERAAHKADVGTAVHEAIHMHYECVPIEPLDEEAQGYFASFLLWDKDVGPGIDRMEERYYDPFLKITGQIDALMAIPGKENSVIIDWKTSSSWNKKMETSWILQGTFYHHLLEVNCIPKLGDDIWFVQLSPDGHYPKVRKFVYSPQDMADCMAALQIYRRFNPIKEGK